MSVLAIIAALVIEQWRPLGDRVALQGTLASWAAWLEQSFNGGERRHGVIAWLVAVVPLVVIALVIHAVLVSVTPLLALAFNIAVLYLTLGFRQFSHYFTDIQLAVKAGDMDRARSLLEHWRGASGVVRTREEVIRLSIEEALLASHRHVFGVLLWDLVLPGPSGAILYRLAAYFAWRWKDMGGFGQFASRVFYVLEWPAVRLTAAAFAVVGDFEDAVYCWRNQAQRWPEASAGILLATGAGALGVKLGMPLREEHDMSDRPELGLNEDADADFMQSTIGLVWRTLVMVLLLLALLWIASWVG